uniref:Uncharacterized protein n=1 Tax=Poecilia mexicana TaxID=48701 RepID=A0A3B3WBJ4_9TELE
DPLPLFYESTEHAKTLLDAGEEIPVDLVAKLVKFQLLEVKTCDQKRREVERLELGNRMFDDVARLIYDCLQWRRQHLHYRDNVRLIPVPTAVTEDVEVKLKAKIKPSITVSVNVDMCYYSKMLDMVPPEACSVPLILHCMLEQVGVQHLPTFLAGTPRWLDCDLVSYMLQSFLPLLNTEEEKNHLLNEVLTTVEKEEDKAVWRHQTHTSVVKGFNPAQVETSILKSSPVLELIQSVAEQRNGDTCWRGMKQQLQHYCTDEGMAWPEVERLFDQSVFEAMPLTTVDQLGILPNDDETQQTQTVIPWGNPLLFAKQKLQTPRTKGGTSAGDKKGKADKRANSAKTPVESAVSIASADSETASLKKAAEPDNVKKHTEK